MTDPAKLARDTHFPTKEAANEFVRLYNLQRTAYSLQPRGPKRNPTHWRLVPVTRYYIVREWGLPHGMSAELLIYCKVSKANLVYKENPRHEYYELGKAFAWNIVKEHHPIARVFGVFRDWRTAVNLTQSLQPTCPFKEYRVLNYKELIAYAKELGIDTDYRVVYDTHKD